MNRMARPGARCEGLARKASRVGASWDRFAGTRRRPRSRGAVRVTASLDPDNSSILVAGGGGVGIRVTRMLKDMGAWVWMLQRTDERRAEIEEMMAIVTNGDATNDDDVRRVFDEIDDLDAVVSTIGGTPGDPVADGAGNIKLIEAAAAKGVKRFVLVTSIGTGDSKDAPPDQVSGSAATPSRCTASTPSLHHPADLANSPFHLSCAFPTQPTPNITNPPNAMRNRCCLPPCVRACVCVCARRFTTCSSPCCSRRPRRRRRFAGAGWSS